ncbi:E3 ubiquitin ISG15 ligase TRIM25-like isoform X2 [Paramuricea clavata]|uniref:E3 ubiquitin ISG15 ligase TRIM25-like isoform X2 n=1 Tax=Paramuricea clavata TaxID=317549 RepID=A0A7D9DT73_PARCT|nr:E3 ubiquitin ISG15 ligase TRIM25-like isoform X2 [Paramuricea clavata]
MFCHDEEEAVCMNCTTYGKHKTHKVSKLTWFSDQQADSIQHKIDCTADVIDHYEDLKSALGSRKHCLKHKVKYIQNTITSRFSQIQSEINSILDAKQESVLSQLDKCSSSQISLLEMQEEAASNFICKLDEKRNYADNFLTDSDESSIAKEKNLHSDMLECLNEAQSHKMLINDMYEVRIDESDHIVKSVNEMVDAWVCSIEETKQDPSLESVSTIWEKQTPCFGDSMNIMFGEASEVVVNNPFEGIDCKLLCDGELQHCATNCYGETNCDLETESDILLL